MCSGPVGLGANLTLTLRINMGANLGKNFPAIGGMEAE
jgi:hypothetical protein